jgi:hypothetical protein
VKLLLDENLPHELRQHFRGHEPITVTYAGWSGRKNGDLLRLAAAAGFDAMITMDDGVAYQQNPLTLPLSIVILSAPSNDIDDLLPLIPSLHAALAGLLPRSIVRVP